MLLGERERENERRGEEGKRQLSIRVGDGYQQFDASSKKRTYGVVLVDLFCQDGYRSMDGRYGVGSVWRWLTNGWDVYPRYHLGFIHQDLVVWPGLSSITESGTNRRLHGLSTTLRKMSEAAAVYLEDG